MAIKDPIEQLLKAKEYARNKGGICFSGKYVKARDNLKWLCFKNHHWEAPFFSVVGIGTWCKECYVNNKKIDIRGYANQKHQKIITNINYYKTLNDIFDFQCQICDEPYKNSLYNFINCLVPCPNCRHGISERIVKNTFEKMFNKTFEKVRPDFLKYEKNLELDGFASIEYQNKTINIAFEHQGEQHYSDCFDIGERFKKIQNRDDFKRKKCEENNIILIEIPQLLLRTKIEDLPSCIIKQISAKLNLDLLNLNKIDMNEVLELACKTSHNKEKFNEIKKIIENKNGIILSKNYIHSLSKIDLLCSQNHFFSLYPYNLINRRWCPNCAIFDRSFYKKGFTKKSKKFRSRICINYVIYNIGYFCTEKEAFVVHKYISRLIYKHKIIDISIIKNKIKFLKNHLNLYLKILLKNHKIKEIYNKKII